MAGTRELSESIGFNSGLGHAQLLLLVIRNVIISFKTLFLKSEKYLKKENLEI